MRSILQNNDRKLITIKMTILIIFTTLFCGLNSQAQTTKISGKVSMIGNIDLPTNLIVCLHSPIDSSIITYAFSDEAGNYTIRYNGDIPELLISVYAFNIKREYKKIENKSQIFHYEAKEDIIRLEEVLVKAHWLKMKEEKDTINYNVAAFRTKRDITIGDVLKRMPGIDVSKSGVISYNGKAIHKFYIEDLDLLGGRYAIATNNVAAIDVKTVQVLNRHEPIKALKGLNKFNEKVALNLKLEEKAKGKLLVNAEIGGGYDGESQYLGELSGMYFGKKGQNISTAKANNCGIQLSSELKSFYGIGGLSSAYYTNVQMPSPPSIDLSRYLFNNSISATTNNLNKLKSTAQLRTNLSYLNNKEICASYARSEYILTDSTKVVILENIASEVKENTINGDLNYNKNQENRHVENQLNVSLGWNDKESLITSDEHISQTMDDFLINVNNNTNFIFRNRKRGGMKIEIRNSFNTLPHELIVNPGVYPEIFNDSIAYSTLKQCVRSNNIFSGARLDLLVNPKIGKIQIIPKGNINVLHQTLNSYFTKNDGNHAYSRFTDSLFQNDIRFTRLATNLGMTIQYTGENYRLNLGLPISIHYTKLSNNQSMTKDDWTKFYCQPTMSFTLDMTSDITMRADYRLSNSTQTLKSLYEGYILSGYRSLNANDGMIYDSETHQGSIGMKYKNVLRMFFANANISAQYYKSDVLFEQTFDGILAITKTIDQPNEGGRIYSEGEISKGYNWCATLIKLSGNWGYSKRERLRNSSLINYIDESYGMKAVLSMSPIKMFSFSYNGDWRRSKSSNSVDYSFAPYDIMTNNFDATINLPLNIGMVGKLEHYYNNSLEFDRNMQFADLGLFYTYKEMRIQLNWTNILNTSKYVTSSNNGLDSYYSEYQIRPSMIMLKVRFKVN